MVALAHLLVVLPGWIAGRLPDADPSFYISHPFCLLDCLDDGDSFAVPLDGGHGDCPGQVLSLVGGGSEDNPLLSEDVLLSISLTPAPLAVAQMAVTVSQYHWMEATTNAPVKSLAWLLVVTRMIHFLVGSCCGGLDSGDGVVVPQDGGHGERPGHPLLSGDVLLSVSPTPAPLAAALMAS